MWPRSRSGPRTPCRWVNVPGTGLARGRTARRETDQHSHAQRPSVSECTLSGKPRQRIPKHADNQLQTGIDTGIALNGNNIRISDGCGQMPAFGHCAEFNALVHFSAFDESCWHCIEFDGNDHCSGAQEWRMRLSSNVCRAPQLELTAKANRSLTKGDRKRSNDWTEPARQVRFWRASVSKHSERVWSNTANMPLTSGNTPPSGALLAVAQRRAAGRDGLRWSGSCREPATLLANGFHAIVGVRNSTASLANSAESAAIVGVAQ